MSHTQNARRLLQTPLLTALIALLALLAVSPPAAAQAPATNSTEILPLSQVRAGMKGYAYTIFAGDQVEKFDLEVLGVLDNFLGPGQSIILVQLVGPKVEHTGVVAGMSGSPVYLEGKLAGALSLKLGIFTKEAIGGVTPIEDALAASSGAASRSAAPSPLPAEFTAHNSLPPAATLEPIATPLVFSGFDASTVQKFAPQIESYGFVPAQGGTAPARPDDSALHPGEMAGMVLVSGDLSISSACTVTAIRGDRVTLCGHPFLSLGDVQFPMARSRVVMTLASELASTKIVNIGAPIGTITSDHLTAVSGRLGPTPQMIPFDLTLVAGGKEKKLRFALVNHPKLTPLLVAITTFTGLSQNALYGESTTLHLQGEIRVKGHSTIRLENAYAPADVFSQDAFPIALAVQSSFMRLYTNTTEAPAVEGISLRVESTPGRQSFTIDSAWLEKTEARPGESVHVRVLLRPYRGPARVADLTVRVPEQSAPGTVLRVLVSDADWLNRSTRGFSLPGIGVLFPPSDSGLEQLISVINRERHNDRVYAGLFAPAPSLVWADKEMPNIPLSQVNVLDGRPGPGGIQYFRESLASEDSLALGGPVAGVISLSLTVR